MEIIKIKKNILDEKTVSRAAEILKNDGLVIYPTETLYALGANALSEDAVRKVFKAKGRDFNKPVSVAVKDLYQAREYFEFNELAEKIAKKFLPGPLTIILPSNNLPKILSPTGKFSFRTPDNKVALTILKRVNFPVTATSANISGGVEPADAEIAIKQIEDKVDMVLDNGKCKYGKPSTVVDLSGSKLKVVRKGVVSKEELE